MRATTGEIVSVNEIFERKCNAIKNYGIAFKYDSRRGTINMYKEFRATTLCGAVSLLFNEMAGKHSGRADTIHIIKTMIVPKKDLVRAKTILYSETSLRFPKITETKRAPTAAHRSDFTASRPIKI